MVNENIWKRGAATIEPHELVFILDSAHPSYDVRVDNEVSNQDVINAAAMGIGQSVRIRPESSMVVGGMGAGETLPVIVDGNQRIKRALIVNHINGTHVLVLGQDNVPGSVFRAIDRMMGDGSAKTVVGLCPTGLKVPFLIERGDEGEAFAMKVVLNEYREGSTTEQKVELAKKLERFGKSHEEIAAYFKVELPTVKRWLAPPKPETARTSEKREDGKRGKSFRPKTKEIVKLFQSCHQIMTEREQMLMTYILGTGQLPDGQTAAEAIFGLKQETEASPVEKAEETLASSDAEDGANEVLPGDAEGDNTPEDTENE